MSRLTILLIRELIYLTTKESSLYCLSAYRYWVHQHAPIQIRATARLDTVASTAHSTLDYAYYKIALSDHRFLTILRSVVIRRHEVIDMLIPLRDSFKFKLGEFPQSRN